MVGSGKYLGLLTSFGLAFFMFRLKRLKKTGVNQGYAKFLVVTGLIIICIGIFIFYQFPGDWEKLILHKAQAAKSERAIEDVVDAVKTITDNNQRIEILKRIALNGGETGNIKMNKHVFREFIRAIIQSGGPDPGKLKYLKEILETLVISKQRDIQACKEIFQGTIHLAGTLETAAHKTAAVKEILLTIVKIGEVQADKELCQQAIDVVQTINFRARLGLFKEIAAAVAKTVGKEWAKVIFLQLINEVETITTNGWFRYDLISGVLPAVSSRKDMKGETGIFTAAINAANSITYWRNKSLALQAIAVALAKVGDIQLVAEGVKMGVR